MNSDAPAKPFGWHVIAGELLLDLLRRVAAGEDPELVYLELYANADQIREDYGA